MKHFTRSHSTAFSKSRAIITALMLSCPIAGAQITVVNMIPQSLSGETGQDSEPNLAVNPANPLEIAGSAFTFNPGGTTSAPIYVSTNGGGTWVLNNIVPSANGGTGDITLRFGGTGNTLYTGILRGGSGLRLNILRTNNFAGSAAMTLLVDRTGNGVDQPYVQAATVTGGSAAGRDRVYVGNNDDVQGPGDKTATIDRSLDARTAAAPAGFINFLIESRATNGQDLPPIRPAVHQDGTVYAIYYGWRSGGPPNLVSDVVVVRDDNWGTGPNPFTALTDPGDNAPGRRVVTGRNVPFENFSHPALGQERLVASNISIAVDPSNSSTLYIAWADRVGASDYTLHVRRSTDRGANWSAADLLTITNATNPALAINSCGMVGFLCQQVTGSGATQRWETHLRRSNNGTTWQDQILANVPANAPAPTFLPYIGDYVHLMAVGENFYGIFSANNTPNMANFPNGVTFQRNIDSTTGQLRNVSNTANVAVSIDPFFFKATTTTTTITTPSVIPTNVISSFQATSTGKYVCAENAGAAPLVANRPQELGWEQFQIVDVGGGNVAIRSLVNGKLVCAENAGASPLIANRNAVGTWEQFQLLNVGGGNVALRAIINGLYVSAGNAGDQLIANRSCIGGTEQFILNVSLRSFANGRFVCAENAGASPLIANRNAIGTWEQFQLWNTSPGYFALKAKPNGKYVCAENAGNSPLIANRSVIGTWEQFQWIPATGGHISLKALVNGRFVCAENAGASALIANRTWSLAWEQFY
jgi:hypothetical protein